MSESMVLERLAGLEPDWEDVLRRSGTLRRRQLRRQALLTVGGLLAAAALAGGAYAAVRAIWTGHDMTPADINAQATTVYNDKWSVCRGRGHCTEETGTHKQVDILPSMGVVFVLPDANGRVGYSLYLVPGALMGLIPSPPPGWGTQQTLGPPDDPTGGVWRVQRPDGSIYAVAWSFTTGSVVERVTHTGGKTTTVPLTAGDVVPLIPGSLASDPRTLDKAVSFDLPDDGTRVIIFPQLNETYVGVPTYHGVPGAHAGVVGAGEAAKYGLTPIGAYNGKLPVTPSGGTWTAHLPGGLTRTISWHAGDSFVTVTDTTAAGTTTTQVPIGHELPLVPFK